MKTELLDNPPAFPNSGEIFIDGPQGRMAQSAWGMEGDKGLTTLDYFAAKVMQGFIAHGKRRMSSQEDLEDLAARSYKIAVEMLKARQKYL